MNEDELKAIWQKNVKPSLENFDFEAFKQRALKSQKKLQRKIKKEIFIGALIYLVFIPIFWFFPLSLLFIPLIIVLWWWYLWELKRIYQLESEFPNFESFKDFLQLKRIYLRGYFKRTRIINLFGTPILFLLSLIIFATSEQIIQNPLKFAVLMLLQLIIVTILIEAILWFIYRPHLVETEDLLRQLDETQ